MSEVGIPIHYVCKHDDARRLIKQHGQFWISNCGCRETNKDGCRRSRIDVCLFFAPHDSGSGTNIHQVTRAEVDAIMQEAQDKWLVARPFRNKARTETEGICFCCDCCCGYFAPGGESACDKGKEIERTKLTECTGCEACIDVCYFKARKMRDGRLLVDREMCYGCGLCALACPVGCVQMVSRR